MKAHAIDGRQVDLALSDMAPNIGIQTLQMRKPTASRNRSVEIYLLAKGKRP
ncbi:MAG: hypothetical protein Q8O34_08025 [Rhodocyclaceae bacterium]|nr:hypothetical protein [Rhodocyclaceae bacterium]